MDPGGPAAGKPPDLPGLPAACALLVVDVQLGFEDPSFGTRNNPSCEQNVARLIAAWRERHQPVVFVRHESRKADSPLAPGSPGNQFKPQLQGEPDLVVTKHVHSAFYGQPDLDHWLQDGGVEAVAICGITTDHCCETTARMASDLGYATTFVLDATHTFDRVTPTGELITADEVARATAASLHGEFAAVLATDELLAGIG